MILFESKTTGAEFAQRPLGGGDDHYPSWVAVNRQETI
jgi:hypothetical protein